MIDQTSAISEKIMMSFVVIEREKVRASYLRKMVGFQPSISGKRMTSEYFSSGLIN